VIDLRNVYRAEEMARHGFDYVRVGARPLAGGGARAR
jgi:hypothetical protein